MRPIRYLPLLLLVAVGACNDSPTAPTTPKLAPSTSNNSINGAQTGHFTVERDDVGYGGHISCTGEHITKPGKNGFVKDEEECTVSDASTYLPQGRDVFSVMPAWWGPPIAYFPLGEGVYPWFWYSDWPGYAGDWNGWAKAVTVVVSPARPDGSAHASIVAYYNG